jgi:7,8-dihydroneopterin aldolase/epimerase/oxygenase
MNIGLNQLKIHCIIGLFADERVQTQDLFIDLDLEVIPGLSVENDCLEEDTVDYFIISEWLKSEITERKFYTLEALCFQCGKKILNDYSHILKLKIKASKPQAISNCKASYVQIELTQN